MSRQTVNFFINEYEQYLRQRSSRVGRPHQTTKKEILLFIWWDFNINYYYYY